MKKTLSILLLVSSLYSDAKLYFGLNYGSINEEFKNDLDAQSSSQMISFKGGYGDINAYAIDLSIDIVDNKSSIFSKTDGKKYALNLEFVKAFDFDTFMNPFFSAGFGSGQLKITNTLQDSLSYGSLNVGVGTFIPINEYFDLEIGYKYKYLSYERVDTIVEKVSYKSHTNTIYSGFNLRF